MINTSIDQAAESLNIVVKGNILSTNVEEIRQEILKTLETEDAQNASWSILHLDIREAYMVDSTGLNFLVALNRHLKKINKALHITTSSVNIKKSFSFIRLDRQATIHLVEQGA